MPASAPVAAAPPVTTHSLANSEDPSTREEHKDEQPEPGQDNFGFGAQIGFDNPNGLAVTMEQQDG